MQTFEYWVEFEQSEIAKFESWVEIECKSRWSLSIRGWSFSQVCLEKTKLEQTLTVKHELRAKLEQTSVRSKQTSVAIRESRYIYVVGLSIT